MVKMLEKHAEHLEELVVDRTRELGEEKKKVEVLLYNILPRYYVYNLVPRSRADRGWGLVLGSGRSGPPF